MQSGVGIGAWIVTSVLCMIQIGLGVAEKPNVHMAVLANTSNGDWDMASTCIETLVNQVAGGIILGNLSHNLQLNFIDIADRTPDSFFEIVASLVNTDALAIHAGYIPLKDGISTTVRRQILVFEDWMAMPGVINEEAAWASPPFAITSNLKINTLMVLHSSWVAQWDKLVASAAPGFGSPPKATYLSPSVAWCEVFASATDSCRITDIGGFTHCHCGDELPPMKYEVTEPKLLAGTHLSDVFINASGLVDDQMCRDHHPGDAASCWQRRGVMNPAFIQYGIDAIEDAMSQGATVDCFWVLTVAVAEFVAAIHMVESYRTTLSLPWKQPAAVIVDEGYAYGMENYSMLPNGSQVLDTGVSKLQIGSRLSEFVSSWNFDFELDSPDPLFGNAQVLRTCFRNVGISSDLTPYLRLALSISIIGGCLRAPGMIPADWHLASLPQQRSDLLLLYELLLHRHLSEDQILTSIFGKLWWDIDLALLTVEGAPRQRFPGQGWVSKQGGILEPYPSLEARFGCPIGTWNALTQCRPCGTGRFALVDRLDEGMQLVQEDEFCALCTPGMYSNGHNKTACNECEPGSYKDANMESCQVCLLGEWQNSSAATACAACSPGFYAARTASTACKPCPRGEYQDLSGASACEICPQGQYADIIGSVLCRACDIGFYSTAIGASSCKTCQSILPGSTTKAKGSDMEDACGCPIGYFDVRAYEIVIGDLGSVPPCERCGTGLSCPGFNPRACSTPVRSGMGCQGPVAVTPVESLEPGFFCSVLPSHRGIVNGSSFVWLQERLDIKGDGVSLCVSDGACPGQGHPSENPCSNGRMGPRCGKCPDGYASSSVDGDCEECGSGTWLFVGAVTLYFLTGGMFHYLWNEKEKLVESVEPVLASVTFDVAIGFLQALGIFSRFSVSWPQEVQQIMKVCRIFLLDLSALRPRCLFSHGDEFQTLYLLKLTLPVALMVVFFLWWPLSRVLWWLSRGKFKRFSCASMMNSLGMVFLALYVSVVLSVTTLMECYQSPNGVRSLLHYPYQECGDAKHVAMIPFFVGGILLYVVFAQGFLAYVCIMLPRNLGKRSWMLATRFLVFQLQPSQWWYQLVLTSRACALAMVTTVAPNSGFWQVIFFSMILLAALLVHLVRLPFNDSKANLLEGLDSCGLICMLLLASWFAFNETDTKMEQAISTSLLVLLMSIVGMVLGSIFHGLYELYHPARFILRRHAMSTKNLLGLRSCCTAIFAASNEDLEAFLLTRGSYQDYTHLQKTVNFTMLELCGLQPKHLSEQRLSKGTKSWEIASNDRLTKALEQAQQQMVEQIDAEQLQSDLADTGGPHEELQPLPSSLAAILYEKPSKPALWI